MKKYFSYAKGFINVKPNINNDNYLQIEICEHTSKEVICLYSFNNNNPLHLHSEDESCTEKSVQLFKNEDINFCKHLDFYNIDNPQTIELFKNINNNLMTEYEEITNNKTIEQLITELEYQLDNQGYNINDSLPQHIIECIHKLNPTKRQIYIKFVEIDYWSRPLYKYVNKEIYLGSLNHLLPDKQIAPNGTIKEINNFFREHPEAFVYFGTEPDCDPNGGKFKEDVQFIILNIK